MLSLWSLMVSYRLCARHRLGGSPPPFSRVWDGRSRGGDGAEDCGSRDTRLRLVGAEHPACAYPTNPGCRPRGLLISNGYSLSRSSWQVGDLPLCKLLANMHFLKRFFFHRKILRRLLQSLFFVLINRVSKPGL